MRWPPLAHALSALKTPLRRAQVLDLSEFMSVYEAPIDLKMSSASVWPANKPLLY